MSKRPPNRYSSWPRPVRSWCASRSTPLRLPRKWPTYAHAWTAWAVMCRWSATSITTVIVCSPTTPIVRRPWRNTASIRNVGRNRKEDDPFTMMIETAIRYDKPVRIGVNWGSLDQNLVARMMDENSRLAQPKEANEVTRAALIASALESAQRAERLGMAHNRIVLSCKVSEVQDLIAVYRALSIQCDYALHLGLTDAGMGSKGIVASTAALAILLQEGIGDTIRMSLT